MNFLKPLVRSIIKFKIVRYIIAGGTGFCVGIISLYFLTEVFNLWYIFSATLSFIFATVVSFILQKFFTFTNYETKVINSQAVIYLALAMLNLFFNNLILYFLVEFLKFWYIAGQGVASIVVALWSFFAYKWLFRGDV